MINYIAPAKLNLYLTITGKRTDGYHLLDSLFVFTQFGDEIVIDASDQLSLVIDGPYKSALASCPIEKNIAYRAAKLLKVQYNVTQGATIQLTKNIPVCAGIGGGSADAATVIHALNDLWTLNLSDNEKQTIGLQLGADVPACLFQQSALITGIGEIINPINNPLSSWHILLVNPQKPLATGYVFDKLGYAPSNNVSKPTSPSDIPQNPADFLQFLLHKPNDLEKPAMYLLPEIEIILRTLRIQSNCQLARMSGSGPTCFALFENKHEAEKAKHLIEEKHPHYWTLVTTLTN